MGYKYATEEERLQGIANSQKKYKETEKYKASVKRANAKVLAERKVNDEKREKYNAYQREYRERKKLEQPQKEKKVMTAEERLIRRREIANKSYHNNKHKHKERQQKYYTSKREEILEKNKQYYQEHKLEVAERKRQWRLRKIMEQRKNEIDKGE